MILEKLQDTFGPNIEVLKPAMFYDWEYALRFDLGCTGTYVQIFTEALNRCLKVFRHVFKNSNEVYLLLRLWEYQDSRKRHNENLRSLLECGFKLPRDYQKEIVKTIIEPYSENDDEEPEYCREHLYLLPINIHGQNALAVIWAIISNETGIRPTAELSGHFIDFQNKLIVHPYDDRGMDVVAIEKEVLLEAYQTFHDWLLSYDLEKMKSTFGLI